MQILGSIEFGFIWISLLASGANLHAQSDSSVVSSTLISEMSRDKKHEMLRCPIHQKNMLINTQFSLHNRPSNASDKYPFSIFSHLRRYCLPCSRKHRKAIQQTSKQKLTNDNN